MSFPTWLLLPSCTSLLLAWGNASQFELYLLWGSYRNDLISPSLTMDSVWVLSLLGRFFSCFYVPVLIMQVPVHPCLFVSECFSSYWAGERGHQAGDTWGVGVHYSLIPLGVEGKGVGGNVSHLLVIQTWAGSHFNVPSVPSLLVPQKVSERSIAWLAFELVSLHEPWKRKGRW